MMWFIGVIKESETEVVGEEDVLKWGHPALLTQDTLVQPELYQAPRVHAQALGCPVPFRVPANTWHGHPYLPQLL